MDRRGSRYGEVLVTMRCGPPAPRGRNRCARTCARFLCASVAVASSSQAAQRVIDGPAGSGIFGASVIALPNGNFVVTDPGFDAPGPISNVGAVHLYRADGTRVSTLTGTRANDAVGSGGVFVLASGNFVVRSSVWDNGAAVDAGAVTFGSSSTGVAGIVSASNSLIGTQSGDSIGNSGILRLNNGNYVVCSAFWNNGAINDAGAATWGSGSSGVSGAVSAVNSLVGSRANDLLGDEALVLSNGNYVILSAIWDNGSSVDAGAAIFGSGTTGIAGVASATNALIGTQAGDQVGAGAVGLTDGDYVVLSPNWRNGTAIDAGAATFGSGSSGIRGTVTSSNSLVGTRTGDRVGSSIAALSNGNYVVMSPFWDDGALADVGAATFASGATGGVGTVDASNSLIGSNANDQVGLNGAAALTNGNYVVRSPKWDDGMIADAGAATWGSGTTGVSGTLSAANSLVGDSAGQQVGAAEITALGNGNYVVRSPAALGGVGAFTFGTGAAGISGLVSAANSLIGSTPGDGAESSVTVLANGNFLVSNPRWDNGSIVDAGAVTFGSGDTGITGVVSENNSLVGTQAMDAVGFPAPLALRNGNYVVLSSGWDRGASVDAGAATFGVGSTGVAGTISSANSLIGTRAGDRVGARALALAGGDYLVLSPLWDDGPLVDVGAATFASGIVGLIGEVAGNNSLLGSSASDQIGSQNSLAFENGRYVVASPLWDSGAVANAGALTLGLEDGSVLGSIDPRHSVTGITANSGFNQTFAYDAERNQLIVGQPNANRVVLHRTGTATSTLIVSDTPDPSTASAPVTFTAMVEASPTFPNDGAVRFSAPSGESCSDATPTPISLTAARFSCQIVFAATGSFEVTAEYLDSVQYAYSASATELHTVANDGVFADGFETP